MILPKNSTNVNFYLKLMLNSMSSTNPELNTHARRCYVHWFQAQQKNEVPCNKKTCRLTRVHKRHQKFKEVMKRSAKTHQSSYRTSFNPSVAAPAYADSGKKDTRITGSTFTFYFLENTEFFSRTKASEKVLFLAVCDSHFFTDALTFSFKLLAGRHEKLYCGRDFVQFCE